MSTPEKQRRRRVRRRLTVACAAGGLLLPVLLWYGWYYFSFSVSWKLGSLRDLREISVTWYGQPLGSWSDAARLRQFRASLPHYCEEGGPTRCGEGSPLLLVLRTRRREVSLRLPVDDCAEFNGDDFCFMSPRGLRLLSTWISADPTRLLQAARYDRTSGFCDYAHLLGQLRKWQGR